MNRVNEDQDETVKTGKKKCTAPKRKNKDTAAKRKKKDAILKRKKRANEDQEETVERRKRVTAAKRTKIANEDQGETVERRKSAAAAKRTKIANKDQGETVERRKSAAAAKRTKIANKDQGETVERRKKNTTEMKGTKVQTLGADKVSPKVVQRDLIAMKDGHPIVLYRVFLSGPGRIEPRSGDHATDCSNWCGSIQHWWYDTTFSSTVGV